MKADKKMIATQLLRLKKAFPQQNEDFFEILMERVESYEYSENELIETVNNVIDTFEYKNLTVASVVKEKYEQKSYNIARL